jgi:hypothetical protein
MRKIAVLDNCSVARGGSELIFMRIPRFLNQTTRRKRSLFFLALKIVGRSCSTACHVTSVSARKSSAYRIPILQMSFECSSHSVRLSRCCRSRSGRTDPCSAFARNYCPNLFHNDRLSPIQTSPAKPQWMRQPLRNHELCSLALATAP